MTRPNDYTEVVLDNDGQTQATIGAIQDDTILRPCVFVWYREDKERKRTAAFLNQMMPPYSYPTPYRNGARFFLRLVEVAGRVWEIHVDNEDAPETAHLPGGLETHHIWGGDWTFTVFDEASMPSFEDQVKNAGGAALFVVSQKLQGDAEGRLNMAAFSQSVVFMGWIRNVKVIWRRTRKSKSG